jgi:hypothetical protein
MQNPRGGVVIVNYPPQGGTTREWQRVIVVVQKPHLNAPEIG